MTDSASDSESANQAGAQTRSRAMLILIVAFFAVPLLLAIIWLKLVQSSDGDLGSTARGELVDPAIPLEDFSLSSPTAAPIVLDDLRGIWTLLYVPEGECGDTCRLNLYHMRQIRLSLNHRMDRVQRVVVSEGPGQLDAALLAEHPGLRVAEVSPAANGGGVAPGGLLEQIEVAVASMPKEPDSIYIVDPLGNLMMRFAPNLPPASMLKDLKHLLKVSRIG